MGTSNSSNSFCNFVFECDLNQHVLEPTHVKGNTVNSLFLVVEIFSDAHVDRKFVTRILFHYENFSPTKYYLIRIFRT